jgi:signal transduction histidine kinase
MKAPRKPAGVSRLPSRWQISGVTPVETPPATSTQQRLERLVVTTSALIAEVSVDSVLKQVVHSATELIGAHYAAVGVLAPDGRLLESFTTYGVDDELRARIGPPPRGHGILGLVIREARPIRLPDLTRHPDSYGFPPHHPPMHSFLGVPIVGRRGAFGNLYLTEKVGGALFTEEDEYIAVLLANSVGAVVENARHHEESARLLEEVHQLHRARERFFAMVNHELRNALAAVYGWSEMLVRKKDPSTVPPAAYEVLDSAQQAIGLINDLLDLSRLDEDRLKPVIRPIDPGSVAKRAVGRMTPAAQARRVTLVLETALSLPACETDVSRVEQILVNLLGNAIQHTSEGSSVRLEVSAHEGFVVFTVRDQGPGVPATELEHIFDIYATKKEGDMRGVGLGLPLSRRLARLLGGDLLAVATDGDGGEFSLQLPAAPES